MTTAADGLELRIERHWGSRRAVFSAAMSWLAGVLTALTLVPLFSVTYMVLWRGGSRLNLALFTELPPQANMPGGGIGNAIVGTAVMVLIASAISVPIGVFAAVYLHEFARHRRWAHWVRFATKVLTGLPSIIAGVFTFAAVVLLTGFSAWAGGIALAILMLPIVVLTAEEALRMVPDKIREAAHGMGATPTQVVWKVVLPTAAPAISTGVMLAVARAAGETAPLLFTAFSSSFWLSSLDQPTPSLAVLIYNFAGQPYANLQELAWAAAFVLVIFVLLVNVLGRWIAHRHP